MATRTVRLDDDAEAALEEIRGATGLPISEALKQGLRVLQDRVRQDTTRTPFSIFRELDLGPGGYAIAPSTDVRRGVQRTEWAIPRTIEAVSSISDTAPVARVRYQSARGAEEITPVMPPSPAATR